MTPLFRIARAMIRADRTAFLRGAALGVIVLAMGAALLGLSGWFVTACAAAGLSGIGIGFDFFRPSAGVRFLALGRAGARYGERMLTHDATLRALSALRLRLYAGVARLPWEAQARLRGAEALNRLTSDVDALDGLLVRLVLPALSVAVVLAGAFWLLWLLVAPLVAGTVIGACVLGGVVSLALTARHARNAAERAETALQTLRARTLDLAQSRSDLTVAGALTRQADTIGHAVTEEVTARNRLEAAERTGAMALSLTTGLSGAAALASGGALAAQGAITPAEAAIGFFVAIALGEGPMLLRRGLAEIGRMQVAGARVAALTETPPRPAPLTEPQPDARAPLLAVRDLGHRRPGAARATFAPLTFSVAPGETVMLSGPSGAGKSTVLSILAGLVAQTSGTVTLMGAPLDHWPDAALRARLTMVPQRSALIGGTVAENLTLALPDGAAPDERHLWDVLDALRLGPVLRRREGLATVLGPGGRGLSGGQARRLTLARAVLRAPRLLLLDEPSEGLDADTAAATLAAIRALLPDAGIVLVSHRAADRAVADRVITL